MDRKIAERVVKNTQAALQACINEVQEARLDIQLSSLPKGVQDVATGELIAVLLILKNVHDETIPSFLMTQ